MLSTEQLMAEMMMISKNSFKTLSLGEHEILSQ